MKLLKYFDHALFGIPYIGSGCTGGNKWISYRVAVTISDKPDLAVKIFRHRSWRQFKKSALRRLEQEGYKVIIRYMDENIDSVLETSWNKPCPFKDENIAVTPIYMVMLGDTYIGNPRDVYEFIKKGVFLYSNSLGFSEKEQRWYGFSHRATCSFGIGDKVDSPDHCCANSGWIDEVLEALNQYLENGTFPDGIDDQMKQRILSGEIRDNGLPVGFVAKTLADAKKMAMVFAESVN